MLSTQRVRRGMAATNTLATPRSVYDIQPLHIRQIETMLLVTLVEWDHVRTVCEPRRVLLVLPCGTACFAPRARLLKGRRRLALGAVGAHLLQALAPRTRQLTSMQRHPPLHAPSSSADVGCREGRRRSCFRCPSSHEIASHAPRLGIEQRESPAFERRLCAAILGR